MTLTLTLTRRAILGERPAPPASAGLTRGLPLVRGSAWLVATVAVNAASGFAFWLAAARSEHAADVGRASALLTSVLFVNYATSMGLPVALARHGSEQSRHTHVLFGRILLYTSATSVLGTLLFVAAVPGRIVEPLWQWGTVPGLGFFAAIVAGMSYTVLVDVRLAALRRWGWVLVRVAIVGVVRLALLSVGPVGDATTWLFLLAAGLPALSGCAGAALLHAEGLSLEGPAPDARTTLATLGYASVNYVGMLAAQAPQFALPVLVLLRVSPVENAAFYVAWSITTFVFLVPATIGQVLLVEGGRDATDLESHTRVALRLAGAAIGLAVIVSILGAPIISAAYGSAYGRVADLLPLLVLAGVPWSLTTVALNRARVLADHASTLAITVTFAVGVLGLAVLLVPARGADGAVTAWIVGNMAAATIAWGALRRRR